MDPDPKNTPGETPGCHTPFYTLTHLGPIAIHNPPTNMLFLVSVDYTVRTLMLPDGGAVPECHVGLEKSDA